MSVAAQRNESIGIRRPCAPFVICCDLSATDTQPVQLFAHLRGAGRPRCSDGRTCIPLPCPEAHNLESLESLSSSLSRAVTRRGGARMLVLTWRTVIVDAVLGDECRFPATVHESGRGRSMFVVSLMIEELLLLFDDEGSRICRLEGGVITKQHVLSNQRGHRAGPQCVILPALSMSLLHSSPAAQ